MSQSPGHMHVTRKGECLPEAASIKTLEGDILFHANCSSVDMNWSYTTPCCIMSRMK